jgi:hypothetical protein
MIKVKIQEMRQLRTIKVQTLMEETLRQLQYRRRRSMAVAKAVEAEGIGDVMEVVEARATPAAVGNNPTTSSYLTLGASKVASDA